jgi:patatin-like phospholipase/acyl hydrolase
MARIKSDSHAYAARKILCLDGGGVRGLASLMIVKHLMQRLESQRGGRVEPWQEFDMIAGTSTGGLTAIMLGRLRMPVDDCIDAYKRLSRTIFAPVHSQSNVVGRAVSKLKAEGKFESEPLERVVKEMCRERGLSESQLLKDGLADSPKVFVCAAQGANSDAVVIRSYPSGSGEWDDLYDVCRIWEAARATSAASTFFEPIEIGHQLYVDGALRYNNPIEKADQESRGEHYYPTLKVTELTKVPRALAK